MTQTTNCWIPKKEGLFLGCSSKNAVLGLTLLFHWDFAWEDVVSSHHHHDSIISMNWYWNWDTGRGIIRVIFVSFEWETDGQTAKILQVYKHPRLSLTNEEKKLCDCILRVGIKRCKRWRNLVSCTPIIRVRHDTTRIKICFPLSSFLASLFEAGVSVILSSYGILFRVFLMIFFFFFVIDPLSFLSCLSCSCFRVQWVICFLFPYFLVLRHHPSCLASQLGCLYS